MKTDSEFHGKTHYLFRRDQVLSVDVREFLQFYDPRRLSPFQLRSLFNRITLEVEDAAKCGDLATIPEGRRLIQRLNALWPWTDFFGMDYFLRYAPISHPAISTNKATSPTNTATRSLTRPVALSPQAAKAAMTSSSKNGAQLSEDARDILSDLEYLLVLR